jgi:hypothetical protein
VPERRLKCIRFNCETMITSVVEALQSEKVEFHLHSSHILIFRCDAVCTALLLEQRRGLGGWGGA